MGWFLETARRIKDGKLFARVAIVAASSLAMIAGCASEDSRQFATAYAPAAGHGPAAAAPARALGVTRPSPPEPIPPMSRTDPSVRPARADGEIPPPSPLVMPPAAGTYPIDLATALRLADAVNPTIGAARTRILEALALQLSARTLLVPSLNSGASYHGHTGAIQRSSGKIIDVSLQSLYVGAGASAVVAGTVGIPGVNIFSQLTDAWFEPLAARQRLAGARFGAQATSYEILLDVAVLHIELLGNQSILEMQRLSESQFHEVYRLNQNYFETGEGREADAYRARSQWKRQRALVQKAEEDLAVASSAAGQPVEPGPIGAPGASRGAAGPAAPD